MKKLVMALFLGLCSTNLAAEEPVIDVTVELDTLLNEINTENVNTSTYQENFGEYKKANILVLQILNKISTRSERIELEAGSSIAFDNYYIKADTCWTKPKDQITDDIALIEFAATENDNLKKLYHGWLFSASPSLASVKHPIYDLSLIACR